MAEQPVLIDISCLCDEHADGALEYMAKAVGEDPPDGWEPHANPYIRSLVEMFTKRGLMRFDGVRQELQAWLAGKMHRPPTLGRPRRPSPLMVRWSAAELDLTALYLRSLPREAFALEDWGLLVDYLVQRYLPPGDMRTEAEWFSTRTAMMGRVEAAMDGAGEAEANATVISLPPDPEIESDRVAPMTPLQQAVIDYGRARCAENVRAITEVTRHKLRQIIVDHQQAVFLGAPAGGLESKLLDTFGTLNRDWRRIAVTEATENADQGFVASCKPGTRIRRVEKYRGACAFCRSIDGRIMTCVDPAKPEKDGENEVWVGKTNVGRSAAARKRVNGELVERDENERLWVAAGAMHPHCRGSWVKDVEGVSEDPQFEAWLAGLKGKPQ
jgi:hypothetical protein